MRHTQACATQENELLVCTCPAGADESLAQEAAAEYKQVVIDPMYSAANSPADLLRRAKQNGLIKPKQAYPSTA